MKKALFIIGGIMGVGVAAAATSVVTSPSGARTRTTVNYERYESSRTSAAPTVERRTYAAPQRATVYRNMDAGYVDAPVVRSSYVAPQAAKRVYYDESYSRESYRKYFLANPFFQPMANKFGIIADFGYASNSFDFNIPTILNVPADLNGAFDMDMFSLKLDASYGITDRLSIMGMLRYDDTKYKIDWAMPNEPDDNESDSGVNMYGLGLQWRFVDTDRYIATLSGYYQNQVDVANIFIADLKAGYKINTSTFYGLLRGWYTDFDGNAYGVGVTDGDNIMFLAYKTGKSSATYLEGGIGVFTVLAEDWTFNLEGILGNYDWHNQASIKGAFGWQPGDSFALNLYGKIAMYDSANDEDINVFWQEPGAGLTTLTNVGGANLDGYSDYSIGLQAIFYF